MNIEPNSFLSTLHSRFIQHMHRHADLDWSDIQLRLESHPDKLSILAKMEQTGGEPDVIGYDSKTDTYLWVDCSSESPIERRSLCYDRIALNNRKENKPKDAALDMAHSMGIELLTEAEYRELQKLDTFDLKTSSWISTPPEIRNLGGALFCDRRYDTVFTYHNGAESYYAGRGWRGKVKVS